MRRISDVFAHNVKFVLSKRFHADASLDTGNTGSGVQDVVEAMNSFATCWHKQMMFPRLLTSSFFKRGNGASDFRKCNVFRLSPASCAQTLGHKHHNEVPGGSMQWLYHSQEHLKTPEQERGGVFFIHVRAESVWRHSGTNSPRHGCIHHTIVQEINIFDSCQRRRAERYCLFFLCPPSTKRYQQPREDRGRLTPSHILIDGCHRYRIWPAACSRSTLLRTTLSLLCIADLFSQ